MLLAIARQRLICELAGGILPAHHPLRHHFQIEWANRLQYFQLLIAHGGGVKRCRRFHSHERGELQDVALNHVAQRTRRFVEATATLHAQRFRCGDLHVVHVIAIPKGLENAVPKAKNQQILHRIFAEIVIDAVNLLFLEDV